MSSPRLVPVVALAAAALAMPATASAVLTPSSSTPFPDPAYGTHTDEAGEIVQNWTADNILGPGEDVAVAFPLRDDGLLEDGSASTFDGGTGLLTRTDDSDVSILNTTRQFGASSGGNTSNATVDGGTGFYNLRLGSSLVCGTTVGLKLDISSIAQSAYNKAYYYSLPTGVRGAYRRTASRQVGQVISDGQSTTSAVDVTGQGGKVKDLRIHIDSIEHRFSTYWLEINLIAPSGKKVQLMSQQGSLDQNQAARPKTLSNVTFSDGPVNGQLPKDASQALAAGYTNIAMKPKSPLAAFDGESVDGTWRLEVKDIAQPLSNRSSRGRGYGFSGNEMAQVGDWQIDTAHALCTGAPEAWFGGPAGQLVLNPAGGTLDASASHDPSLGGSIVKYEWDMDGNGSFEVTTTSPTAPYPAVSAAPFNREIKLRVTDDQGNVSPVVTRTAIYSTPPVISAVTVNPASPVAKMAATVSATASDADAGDTLTYAWDLNGDGVYSDLDGASGSYTWNTSGPQTVRLKVTDSRGVSTYSWKSISIANTNPVARLSYRPIPAVVGQTVTLDGSASTDADGSISKYEWDANGDGTYESATETPTTTTTFASPGEYVVRLTVTDNTGGQDEISIPVWVTAPPVGVISATPASPLVNETVTFSAAQSYDADAGGSIAKYEWDLDGNGSYEVSGATAVSATKSYPNAGTVSVRLRLTDNDGATSITPFALVVRSPNTGGGTGTPAPPKTPTPVATPIPTKPGVEVPVVKIVDDTGKQVGSITNAKVADPKDTQGTNWFDNTGSEKPKLIAEDGFTVDLNATSKQKAKKAYKAGVVVKFTATTANKLVVKATIDAKTAKKLKIKVPAKAKVVSVGSGKLAMTKAGTSKFTVKFNKKYASKLKKQKALVVTLSGLATSSDGTKLAPSKKITIVK
ncbi:MAG: PKD domain-containing protein [Patulibacter minatonensis]